MTPLVVQGRECLCFDERFCLLIEALCLPVEKTDEKRGTREISVMDSDAPPPVADMCTPPSPIRHSLTHSYTWSSRPTASNKPISAVISYDLLLGQYRVRGEPFSSGAAHVSASERNLLPGRISYIWIHHRLTVFRNLLLFSRQ